MYTEIVNDARCGITALPKLLISCGLKALKAHCAIVDIAKDPLREKLFCGPHLRIKASVLIYRQKQSFTLGKLEKLRRAT